MADIVIDHHGDGSPDFITDLILYDRERDIKYWEGGLIRQELPNLCPRVVVIKAEKELRNFGKEPNLYSVFKFHVMDGSETLIRAVTDTGLSKVVAQHSQSLLPGATLLLKDYQVLSMQSAGPTWRKILVIKDMSWRVPPGYNLAPVRSGLTPSPQAIPPAKKKQKFDADADNVKTFRLSWRALHKVEREALVVFTVPLLDQPDIYIWNKMMNAEAKDSAFNNGDWIQDPISRRDWMEEFDPKKFVVNQEVNSDEEEAAEIHALGQTENEPDCECVKIHDFEACVLRTFPVLLLNQDDLFSVGQDRCTRDEYSDVFNEANGWNNLPNNSKRWCCYFWYSTNAFHVRGKCSKLPKCVTNAIRFQYPDAHRRYTGFKTKESRYYGTD